METFVKMIAGIMLVVVLVILFSIPTWLLWNWLMPLLFGLPEITLGQAIGLSFLARMLFGATNVRTSSQ